MKEEYGHTVVENRGNDGLVNLGFANLSRIKTFTEEEVDIDGFQSKTRMRSSPVRWFGNTQRNELHRYNIFRFPKSVETFVDLYVKDWSGF